GDPEPRAVEVGRAASPAATTLDAAEIGAGEAGDSGDPPREVVLAPSPRRSRFLTGVAIVLTSLFFAAVHAAQWPAPIALFVLALAIGTVYERTGSLIAAVCMHAVFNGISTLGLFFAVLE